MQTIEMFGTELRTTIEDLNGEPELRRIGLSFFYANGSIWIKEGPRPGADLANRMGVGEAISRHLSAGGIHLALPMASGDSKWLKITPGRLEELDKPS
ncbi:hypothetical protein [Paracoccus fistulariae]|uniref:Uncharacterized protein n=1 Tax=Paracoccus fistulariae TaxID=658446 RepID=A0ABY7SI84_9RHOB|nr:hypothetical protein [Paracoccus fistulariae]MDB6182222.1 hypothetical protein [Paracoccus fistulariae]WCR06559.1 hypothetical protein JHX87_13875 [Paracoccus fistulariae]